MTRSPMKFTWFWYWVFTGRNHPAHVQWWADELKRERRATISKAIPLSNENEEGGNP